MKSEDRFGFACPHCKEHIPAPITETQMLSFLRAMGRPATEVDARVILVAFAQGIDPTPSQSILARVIQVDEGG